MSSKRLGLVILLQHPRSMESRETERDTCLELVGSSLRRHRLQAETARGPHEKEQGRKTTAEQSKGQTQERREKSHSDRKCVTEAMP